MKDSINDKSSENPVRNDGVEVVANENSSNLKTLNYEFSIKFEDMTNFRLDPERYRPKSHDTL